MSTEELPPRESMEFDVVIVGAGPSGLAAAIRLKQLNADLPIAVVEKGSEVRPAIPPGAVVAPVSFPRRVRDRPGCIRQVDPGLARRRRLSAQDAGEGRPVLSADQIGRLQAAEFHAVA